MTGSPSKVNRSSVLKETAVSNGSLKVRKRSTEDGKGGLKNTINLSGEHGSGSLPPVDAPVQMTGSMLFFRIVQGKIVIVVNVFRENLNYGDV